MAGLVVALFRCAAGGAPMEAVPSLEAIAGHGIAGDRYAEGRGYWSYEARYVNDVTLIDEATIERVAAAIGLPFHASESRRNIVTRGIDLQSLIGREFSIGPVRLRGDRPCEPCRYLETLTGKLVRAPLARDGGGLRATIVRGGSIANGDALTIDVAARPPIVATSVADATTALLAALAMRRRGERFFASVDFPDARTLAARAAALDYAPRARDVDQFRLALDAFGADVRRRPPPFPGTPAQHAAIHELIRLSDGIVVRSWREAERLESLLGTLAADVVPFATESGDIVVDARAAATDVVVWGPHERADALAVFFAALQDLAVPITIVAADAPSFPTGLRCVLAADGPATLARARVVVDTTMNDPSVALALAKLGIPLAVSADGGAAEYLRGVTTYEPWSRRSMLTAVADALGAAPPQFRAAPPALPALEAPAIPPAPPLVSVVIGTYDRPDSLAQTLATIERQTYPHFEIVVVNDGGTSIAGVVAAAPHARLIDLPENRGPAGSRNAGLQAALGTYVTCFDDDDEMFPDHLATLVVALERSGCDVAYGQMINCYLQPSGDGGYRLDAVQTFLALLDHADIQWGAAIAVTAVMWRRSIHDEIGFYGTELNAAFDYEFWLRLAHGREWVRVPAITSMYNWRVGGSNISSRSKGRFATGHRHIYERHPSQRALVVNERAAYLRDLEEGARREESLPP